MTPEEKQRLVKLGVNIETFAALLTVIAAFAAMAFVAYLMGI